MTMTRSMTEGKGTTTEWKMDLMRTLAMTYLYTASANLRLKKINLFLEFAPFVQYVTGRNLHYKLTRPIRT